MKQLSMRFGKFSSELILDPDLNCLFAPDPRGWPVNLLQNYFLEISPRNEYDFSFGVPSKFSGPNC